MDKAEIEEEILGVIAEATVSGGDAARGGNNRERPSQERGLLSQLGLSRLSGEQTVQEAVPLDEAHQLRERAYVDDQAREAA